MSSNTNLGNTPVNQGYVQLIHTGETGGIDGTLRTLYDGDGTASDLQIASNKVKVSTELYIGSKTATEFIQDIVGDMFTTGSYTNITTTYDDTNGNIDLSASGEVTLTGSQTLTNKTLASPTFTGTAIGADLTLSGNLTVNGTTIAVDQTNLNVSDNIIGLNRGVSSNANDSGLIIERGSTGDNAAIIWDESADKFTLGTTTSTPSATGDLTISTGTLVANVEGNVTGNLTTDSVTISTIQTGSESFADNDTSLMTSAAIQDKILSYGYSSGAVSAVANGADNRIATFSSSDALNGEANFTFNGTHARLAATSALYFDGGTHTYIQESSDDFMKIFVGGQQMLGLFEGSTDSVFAPDNVRLGVGNSPDLVMYHDTTNSHILNSNGDLIIKNAASDEDISIQVSDGGSTTTAILIDGSEIGKVRLPNDNQVFSIGAGDDLAMYHNGSNSYFYNANVGDLIIQNNVDDKDIILRSDDGSGGVTAYLTIDGSATLNILHQDTRINDSKYFYLGTDSDFSLLHNNSNAYIENRTGHLYIRNYADDSDIVLESDDGSGGNTPYITLDGSSVRTDFDKPIEVNDSAFFPDSSIAYFGTNNDLRIQHNGSHSFIQQYGTGDLYFDNNNDNQSFIFRTDDGSGGVTTYLKIDGSAERIVVKKSLRSDDNIAIAAGTDGDLNMYHNGTNSFLENWNGDLYIRNNSDDKDILLQTDDGSGGTATYMTLDGSATLTKFHIDTKHIDNVKANFGDSSDLQIYHDGSNSSLQNNTGVFYINQTASASMSLQTNNTQALEITSSQILVPRQDVKMQSTKKLYLDGGTHTYITESANDLLDVYVGGTNLLRLEESGTDSVFTTDNVHLAVGTHKDLRIYHNSSSSNNNIENHSGSLYVTNYVDDADIIFRNDDGSGGVTEYFRLDGGESINIFSKNLRMASDAEIHLQTGGESIAFMGVSDANYRKALYSTNDDHYLTNRHTGGDLILMSNNGSAGGETERLRFVAGSGTQNAYFSNVNVGIGETSPDCKLHLANNVATSAGFDSFADYQILLYDTGTSSTSYGMGIRANTFMFNSDDDFEWRRDNSAKMFLDGSEGRLGIGTTSPSEKLDVVGSAEINGLLYVSDSNDIPVRLSSTDAGFAISMADSNSASATHNRIGVTTNDMTFHTNNSEAMRIDSSGNVLIGGTSASGHGFNLEVLNDHAYVKGPDGWNGTGDKAIVALGSGVSNESFGCGYVYGTGLVLSTYKLSGGGDFGSSTQNSLVIADTTGQASFINDVVAFASSDKRLKENVKPLDNALDKINKINGVEFDWIDGKDEHGNSVHSNEGHDVGVIAQEIEEVLPEVVHTRDNGYKAVKYEKIVPLLIQAIKEQQQQIEELKNG